MITRGQRAWGVEVKSSMTATSSDGRGLRRLAEHCGPDYQGGVVLYGGEDAFPLGGGNLAMPLSRLWTM